MAVAMIVMIVVMVVIMCILLRWLGSTAATAIAGVVTVEQTCIRGSAKTVCVAGLPAQGLTRRSSVYAKVSVIGGWCGVIVFGVEAELRLDS
jgi:hypothetical protein